MSEGDEAAELDWSRRSRLGGAQCSGKHAAGGARGGDGLSDEQREERGGRSEESAFVGRNAPAPLRWIARADSDHKPAITVQRFYPVARILPGLRTSSDHALKRSTFEPPNTPRRFMSAIRMTIKN